MIRQILVYDPEREIIERIQKVFSVFIRGYQIFHAKTVEEAVTIERNQMIDVVVINGDAFVKDKAGGDMRVFKHKILPPPKILLLLEENLVNTLPQIEGVADAVFNLSSFRALRFRRTVHDLVHKKYAEEWQKEKQELDEGKLQSQSIQDELHQICKELKKNPDQGQAG
ncbi:MAG: hypothetical protein V2A70_07910 [Candidatus Omnitrophota bacterium]